MIARLIDPVTLFTRRPAVSNSSRVTAAGDVEFSNVWRCAASGMARRVQLFEAMREVQT